MFRNFFRRVDAGPQSSEQTYTHEEGVTVTYTEDTSEPYPHYMHQPATSIGQVATEEQYAEMVSEPQSAEAESLAGRLLTSIWGGK